MGVHEPFGIHEVISKDHEAFPRQSGPSILKLLHEYVKSHVMRAVPHMTFSMELHHFFTKFLCIDFM